MHNRPSVKGGARLRMCPQNSWLITNAYIGSCRKAVVPANSCYVGAEMVKRSE